MWRRLLIGPSTNPEDDAKEGFKFSPLERSKTLIKLERSYLRMRGEVWFIGIVEEAGEESTIRIYPQYCPGLLGIEAYSHIIVLYWMHLRDDEENRRTLRVIPQRHEGAPPNWSLRLPQSL